MYNVGTSRLPDPVENLAAVDSRAIEVISYVDCGYRHNRGTQPAPPWAVPKTPSASGLVGDMPDSVENPSSG